MSSNDKDLSSIKRFRLLAVRLALLGTFLITVPSWFYDPRMAQGVLLGGIAGVLGFWIIAVRLEKIVHVKPEKVQFAALTWSAYRFALYGAVLYKTFTLDRETYHGLIGGLIGIMIIRAVLVFVAVTGMDKPASTGNTAAESSSDSDAEKN